MKEVRFGPAAKFGGDIALDNIVGRLCTTVKGGPNCAELVRDNAEYGDGLEAGDSESTPRAVVSEGNV
jgi:hypothetical protein